MEKETYTPQIYIKIDKVIFKGCSFNPSFDKYDNKKFVVVNDEMWSDLYKGVKE